MHQPGRRRTVAWFAALALCAASGCVVPECFTFAKYFNSPNPPPEAGNPPPVAGGPGPHPGPAPGPCPVPPPGASGEGVLTGGPGGPRGAGAPRPLSPDLYNPPPPPPGPPPYEQLSLVSQRLALTEDEVKVAKTRLQLTEAQLQEREQALGVAQQEIEAARKSLSQAQEEVQRWRKELEALRRQLKKTEDENKHTLEAIIRLLEEMLGAEPKPKKPGEEE